MDNVKEDANEDMNTNMKTENSLNDAFYQGKTRVERNKMKRRSKHESMLDEHLKQKRFHAEFEHVDDLKKEILREERRAKLRKEQKDHMRAAHKYIRREGENIDFRFGKVIS